MSSKVDHRGYTDQTMSTAIHRRVARLQSAADPTHIARVRSGWVVMGERQVLPGYCLLLPDPVVETLNDLGRAERAQFLDDMVRAGDAILQVTQAVRINYEMLGNLEPALHAHLFPRRLDEPESLRTKPIWFHDWDAAPAFDAAAHRPLQMAIAEELMRQGVSVRST